MFPKPGLRDGSKFMGYPGRDHRSTEGEDFFSKKKIGAGTFTKKSENPRSNFSKLPFLKEKRDRSNFIGYLGLFYKNGPEL